MKVIECYRTSGGDGVLVKWGEWTMTREEMSTVMILGTDRIHATGYEEDFALCPQIRGSIGV